MPPLVTVGIPVYQRLHFLPQALRCVQAQDYPDVDLLVSDNGANGDRVREIVEASYDRAFRLRQTTGSVSSARHFNQIIGEARGEYFVLLADDDEISPNFVSSLVTALEREPDADVALSCQESMDEQGRTLRRSVATLPASLDGVDLIRAAWRTYEFRFLCFVTTLARTAALRRVGGFPEFTGATHDDDAVLIKLAVGRRVALDAACTFRWRVHDQSHGWSISLDELAACSREFLAFLDGDPTLRAFAASQPSRWRRARADITHMVFDTYYRRWCAFYRARLTRTQWVRAAFLMPWNRVHALRTAATLGGALAGFTGARLGRILRSHPTRA